MRTIETTAYKFSELSDDAQQTAHNNYLTDGNFEYSWIDEAIDTLNKFASIFPITVNNYSLSSQSCDVEFNFDESEEIENLSGARLAKYLWNNYKRDLDKGKYYSVKSDKIVRHKRVKSETLSNGKVFNAYYSAITMQNDCVLTGVCFDYVILQPIYDFMKNPKSDVTFSELIGDCIQEFEKDLRSELESQETFEYFKDHAEANEYEYDENGEMI